MVSSAFCATLLLGAIALVPTPCLGILRDLGLTADAVGSEHVAQGGSCANGCVRTVVDAVAISLGEVDCDLGGLRVENLLDHTDEDVMGGALNVVHYCSNVEGELMYQGQGACQYSVCVNAEWKEGQVTYAVVVTHEAEEGAAAEHTVHVQVYMNEYEDLEHVQPSLSVGSSAASGAAQAQAQCQLGNTCEPSTACPTGTSEVKVVAKDAYGDGWTGALLGRANTWAVTESVAPNDLASPVADGTLPDHHYSGVTTLCLEDGLYAFKTTADAAWSSEATWSVCGVEGGAGGSMEFELSAGNCNVVEDSGAGSPPDSDAETSSGDLCTQPSESSCVELDIAVREVSGPSVGMYYDESCLEGGGGRTGCGGGGVPACRLCFVNRDFWNADFAELRFPDWTDCPCCVAGALGVSCQGGGDISVADESFIEKAEVWYWEGGTPMVAASGGLIGLGLLVALCCCWDIRKANQKALSFKHYRGGACEDYNVGGDTSPDVTPPVQRSSEGKDDDDPYPKHSADVEAAAATATLSYGAKNKKSANKRQQPHNASTKPQQRGTAAGRGKNHIAADATDAPDLLAGEVGPPEPIKLPGAAKDCPPSDASWPSDPRVGVSVSGKKNPRWSGSRELRAYLRRTGYDKMEDDDQQQRQQRRQRSGNKRGSDDRRSGERRGGDSRVMQAIKRTGSFLSENSGSRHNNKCDWADDAGGGGGGFSVSMGDIVGMDVKNDTRRGKSRGRRDRDSGDQPPSNLRAVPPPPPVVEAPAARDAPGGGANSKAKQAKTQSRSRSTGNTHRRGGSSRGDGRTAADLFSGGGGSRMPRDNNTSSRSLSSLLSGGNGNTQRRVAPSAEEEPESDAFGDFDASFADRKWGGGVPEPPEEPPAVARSRDVSGSHGPSRAGEGGRGREADRPQAKAGGRGRRSSKSVEPGGAGAEGRGSGQTRSRSSQARQAAALAELSLESERSRAAIAARKREEEGEEELRAEKARKREALEATRGERKLAEEARRQDRQHQPRQELEEKEREEAEQQRAEWARQQKKMEGQERERREAERRERKARQQQQQVEEEEESSRQRQRQLRRRQQENPDPHAPDPRRERGSGRLDARTNRGDEATAGRRGSGRERERGRSVGKEQDSGRGARPGRSESTSNRPRHDTGDRDRDRERNRGESYDGRRREGSGGGDRAARSRSTPAGPPADAATAGGGRESEAERRRTRSHQRGGKGHEQQPQQWKSADGGGGSRERREAESGRPAVRAAPRAGQQGGERRRSSSSPGRGPPAAAAAAAAPAKPAGGMAKKSSATRFSNDPRAKEERAARLREKRLKAGAYD